VEGGAPLTRAGRESGGARPGVCYHRRMRRHRVRPSALLLGGILVAACGNSPTAADGTVVHLGQSFDLTAGETASVSGEDLTVTFESVPADSRCPVNVTCVWAGDATVQLRARKDAAAEGRPELHTNNGPSEAAYEGFRIVLEKLEPKPRDGVKLEPRDYVATLMVSRG
jgi:hypothetical protein